MVEEWTNYYFWSEHSEVQQIGSPPQTSSICNLVYSIVIHGDFGVGSEKGGEAFNGSLRMKRSGFGIGTSGFDRVFKIRFNSLVVTKEDGVVSIDIKLEGSVSEAAELTFGDNGRGTF